MECRLTHPGYHSALAALKGHKRPCGKAERFKEISGRLELMGTFTNTLVSLSVRKERHGHLSLSDACCFLSLLSLGTLP